MKKIEIAIAGMIIFLLLGTTPAKAACVDRYQRIICDEAAGQRYMTEVTAEEIEILQRIVEAEATGGTIEQKKNVVSCVLARVESKEWPNTVEKVVFQNDGRTWQFTPISDRRYYKVKITDSTRKAVNEVLIYGLTHRYTFFCSKKSWEKPNSWHRKALQYGFYDGEHIYCK